MLGENSIRAVDRRRRDFHTTFCYRTLLLEIRSEADSPGQFCHSEPRRGEESRSHKRDSSRFALRMTPAQKVSGSEYHVKKGF